MRHLFFIAVCLLVTAAQAQISVVIPPSPIGTLPMYPILVTVNKTTNLVFPYEIKSVDRGIEGLLVQKVPGAGHILQAKAASDGMPETSLSVVTADMHLYSFLVRYDNSPQTLNYHIKAFASSPFIDTRSGIHQLNEAQIRQDAAQVAGYASFGKNVEASRYGTTLKLNGIYIHENVFYFSLQLENGTGINYDIESLQFLIRDQKGSKRMAQQEIILPSLFAYGDTALIEAHTGQRLIVAIPKFTIPDKKNCFIQLREGNGGRHLECKFGNKLLIRCKSLEE